MMDTVTYDPYFRVFHRYEYWRKRLHYVNDECAFVEWRNDETGLTVGLGTYPLVEPNFGARIYELNWSAKSEIWREALEAIKRLPADKRLWRPQARVWQLCWWTDDEIAGLFGDVIFRDLMTVIDLPETKRMCIANMNRRINEQWHPELKAYIHHRKEQIQRQKEWQKEEQRRVKRMEEMIATFSREIATLRADTAAALVAHTALANEVECGWIYAFELPEGGWFKVGKTTRHWSRRARELFPYALQQPEPIVAIPVRHEALERIEKLIHKCFRHKRHNNFNEVFELNEQDIEWLKLFEPAIETDVDALYEEDAA